MRLIHVAFVDVMRRPIRTALTLAGVTLGIGAYVALVGFSSSFENQWLQYYSSKGTDLCVVRGTFLKASADESLGRQLRGLPVVAGVAAVSFDLIEVGQETSVVVFGWEDSSYELEKLTILEGRRFHGDEAGLMLGEVLASSLDKRVGDTLELQGAPFEVVGIFRGGESFETGGVIMPLHQLQRISDLGPKVSGFHVRLSAPAPGQSAEARLDEAKRTIESRLPGLTAVPIGDIVRNNFVANSMRSITWGTSLLAMAIGALGIANTMAMSVHERTREIGILRAMGWVRHRIVRLILMEASILSIAGGMCGILVGYGGLALLSALRRTVPGAAMATVTPLLGAEALGIALLIGLAAGTLPAYRAASLSPMSALRHD